MNAAECHSAHRTNQQLMQLRARLEVYAGGELVGKLLNDFDASMQAINYELFEATTINGMFGLPVNCHRADWQHHLKRSALLRYVSSLLPDVIAEDCFNRSLKSSLYQQYEQFNVQPSIQ